MQLTVAELARKHAISVPAIYLWVTIGAIPDELVDRSTGRILIESLGFERLIERGRILRRRGRRSREATLAKHRPELMAALGLSEDQRTVRREGREYEHRWLGDSHPYSPLARHSKSDPARVPSHLPAEVAIAVETTLDLVNAAAEDVSC